MASDLRPEMQPSSAAPTVPDDKTDPLRFPRLLSGIIQPRKPERFTPRAAGA